MSIPTLDPERFKKLPGEKAIIAVGRGGQSVFLAFQGETIKYECENNSHYPDDACIECSCEDPGIYYFEGRPEWVPETWESSTCTELAWKEVVFRKATVKDLDDMGIDVSGLVQQLP